MKFCSCGSLNQLRNVINTNGLMSDKVAKCLKQMSEIEKYICNMTDLPPIVFKLSYIGKYYQHFSGIVLNYWL